MPSEVKKQCSNILQMVPNDASKIDAAVQKATYARKNEKIQGIAMGEMGRIRKNDTTEIVIQKTEFRGSVGIDIREYVTSERYTGWSKNGVRIPVEKWKDFKEILDKVESVEQ